MPGATASWDAPLPNSSIEQWRTVVIVAGYTLFVTPLSDVIFTFANQRFGEVSDTTCIFWDAGAAVG